MYIFSLTINLVHLFLEYGYTNGANHVDATILVNVERIRHRVIFPQSRREKVFFMEFRAG